MPKQERKEQDREAGRERYYAADINEKLIINLRDLHHIMHFLNEGKASQKRILTILSKSETITQRDLTQRLGIQPGSASEILFKLESAGWILRTPNEADRRMTDISLTVSGREQAKEVLEQHQKRHEEMFSCLSEEEKRDLLSLLEKVCDNWKVRYRENDKHGRNYHGGCGADGYGDRNGQHWHGGK